MRWIEKETQRHIIAARKLHKITQTAWAFIKSHPYTSEHEVEQFVESEFKCLGLISPKPFDIQIVGFDSHAAIPHYFPKKRLSSRLEPETLILLDIWAKLPLPRSPFADITWMAYCGKKIPHEIQKTFDIVLRARDACISHIKHKLQKREMPTGAEMDKVARDVITKFGYGKNFIHRTGHCIGFTSPHGRGMNLAPKFRRPLELNMGYTIEPGIYIKGKFGIRSEINFYITDKYKLVVTTPTQNKIVRI